MQVEILGQAGEINKQDNTLIIKSEIATAKISVYSPTIIRVQVMRNPDAKDHSYAVIQQAGSNFDFTEDDAGFEIRTSALKLVIEKDLLRFNFYTADGKELSRDDERFGINWQGERVVNYRKVYADERFIGLGEKTGDLDRRGCNYINWNSDVPFYTEKSDPLYQTFPFFIGIHSGATYGLFFDNTHRSFFDFGATTDHKMSWFGADGGDMNYYFFGAQSVAEIIKDYTWLTGRMEMPPLWSLGYQQCRWSYMSAQEILDIAKTFRDHNIPADVMYCDIDYMDGFKIFTWNNETFPDPKSFIDKLKEMGFRLVTIVDPGIKMEEGYKQYDEGVENEYFAKYPNGENFVGEVWPGRCHFPDFFRDDVREWWGASFTALTEPGVEGFWNDMNEPAAWGQNLPWMVKFGDKYMPEVRNVYGMQMARATYEGTKKILGKRPFVLTRAAYSGTQRYSAVWTGDNSAYDEHMLLGQRLVNSLGLSGMSFTGVDIGGFSYNPTPELMVRWNSLGVYTPMYRNHAQQGTVMREPWEWGADNEAIIRKDIELRYQLLPYVYSTFYQSAQTGLPVARSLAIGHTFDAAVYKSEFQNQFMFGDSLLVAPVASAADTARVYLPQGNWYRFGTDEHFMGSAEYTVEAPLNNLPVFAKAGAIIPIQNIVQNTNEKGDGILLIHIWNGEETNTFTYYEDDGLSYDNEQGVYYKRDITFDPSSRQIIFGEVEGSFVSRFDKVQVVMHGFEGLEHTATLDNIKDQVIFTL
ncbi:glycoside hydrolase family 31 protein [Mucilaginibacter ginkgonis]|uniref:Glycoside hydrolase family 31 protein n=1 Tax=Mucilaginibacter ginkgonis TaxID=2682091 RepID=A0A6I4HYN4_9SPHI|nr:glycoside hydrolase family 31 protein [Mucilaginibacter ginkgonis]QQL50425.1 glycoside hydrolase family 31 protein [Mucilaginibacter ginkgonis]